MQTQRNLRIEFMDSIKIYKIRPNNIDRAYNKLNETF